MELIETCRKFIEFDTTPSNGTAELVGYAAELAQRLGFFAEVQATTYEGLPQANIIIRPVEGRPSQELLLQTHLDTVESGPYSLWTETAALPFNAAIHQDKMYGLGTADTKLDFLCKLFALRELVAGGSLNWKRPPVLAGTYGEELGMAGVVKLIRQKKISAQMALVGEPTQLRLVTAGKGFVSVEIEIPFSAEEIQFRHDHDMAERSSTQSKIFLGKPAHSSVPQLGENALIKLFDYLNKLPTGIAIMSIEGGISPNLVPAQAVLEFDMAANLEETVANRISQIYQTVLEVQRQFQEYAAPGFHPPEPTMNLGKVRTYAEHVQISGCCRLPPSVSTEVYQSWMETLAVKCRTVGATFRVVDYKEPFRTDVAKEIVTLSQAQLKKMGRPIECISQAVTNEANVLSRFGIDCAVIGPGQGVGNSHAPNEYVSLTELRAAIEFYKGILTAACL